MSGVVTHLRSGRPVSSRAGPHDALPIAHASSARPGQVRPVARDIDEQRHPPVRLCPWLGHEHGARADRASLVRLEVIDAQEEPHAPVHMLPTAAPTLAEWRAQAGLGYSPDMPLPVDRRKQLFNACDPASPLDQGDPRLVDVDAIGGRGSEEGEDWVSQVSSGFALADGALRVLVSGLPGTGKSTELRRLQRRLESDEGGAYLVCLIDAEEHLDLRNAVDASDVLLAVVIGVEAAVVEAEGKSTAKPAAAVRFFERIWDGLLNRDVSLKEVSATLPVGSVKAELKQNPELRSRVRAALRKDRFQFQREVHDACVGLASRAQKLERQGIVVLFDSLEKLRGDSSTFDTVLASAERIFLGGAPDLALPVHALYTVPPALTLRIRGIQVLPMLKVRDRDGAPYAPGIDAARALIARRIPDDDLDLLVAPGEREGLVREIILMSGGYPRDLVRILRLLVQATKHPLSREAVERILLGRAGEIREIAAGQGLPGKVLLARVHAHKRLEPEAGELPIADRFFAQSLILGYTNGERWVDVHPAVLDLPGFAELVAAQREAGAPTLPLTPPPT